MDSCYANDGARKGRCGRVGKTYHRFVGSSCAIVHLRMEGFWGNRGKGGRHPWNSSPFRGDDPFRTGETGVTNYVDPQLARGEPQLDDGTRQSWHAKHQRGGQKVGGGVEGEAGGGSKRRRGGTEEEKGGRRRDAWGKRGARHWTTSSDVQRGGANRMECERRMRGEPLEWAWQQSMKGGRSIGGGKWPRWRGSLSSLHALMHVGKHGGTGAGAWHSSDFLELHEEASGVQFTFVADHAITALQVALQHCVLHILWLHSAPQNLLGLRKLDLLVCTTHCWQRCEEWDGEGLRKPATKGLDFPTDRN
eukprot:scaffold605_cov346-Pavlova_lutheri.AAC.4